MEPQGKARFPGNFLHTYDVGESGVIHAENFQPILKMNRNL
jgi:hypothetical protein